MMSKASGAPEGRAVLILGHPGHELTLAHWIATTRPDVFVITDGSGQLGRSRLHSTTKVLLGLGAHLGSIYGRYTDRDLYGAMLSRDADFFLQMIKEIADWIVLSGADYVVSDSAEGYNPTHDVCRIVSGGAVELASRLGRRAIGSYHYMVTGGRQDCVAGVCRHSVRIELDDEALGRKLAAARGYPELAGEVDAAIERGGLSAFRYECLDPIDNSTWWAPNEDEAPFYEEHGRRRVAEGKYGSAISYKDHLAPLHAAIWRHLRQSIESLSPPDAPANLVR